MSTPEHLANLLATAFLSGELEVESMVVRGNHLLGRTPRWLPLLAKRVVAHYRGKNRPRIRNLAKFIRADTRFPRFAVRQNPKNLKPVLPPHTMCPVPAAKPWNLPPLCSIREVADWLDVSVRQLDWLADVRSWNARKKKCASQHYRYRPLTKRRGAIRLIEAPKSRLKAVQRQILREIVNRIPPHDTVHGFREGRSITSFAKPHVSQHVVIKMDLEDFFPSIYVSRVQALFRTVGYPEQVADFLAALCTHSTPEDVWDECDTLIADDRSLCRMKSRYRARHLPQGSPTSPGIANLCAYRLDCRLAALAASAGAVYTRYADDLAFSGDDEFARTAKRFEVHAAAVVMEEGFRVHHRKTRIMKRSVRQRIAGLIVNETTNVPRKDFDCLKAILNNCVASGPHTQNRDSHRDFRSHLCGRIAFVESINPNRGRKLRELFRKIEW